MKKMISLLIFWTVTSAHLHGQVFLELPTHQNSDTGVVLVPVYISNLQQAASVTIRIKYDTTALSWLGTENCNPSLVGAYCGMKDGIISLAWASGVPATIQSGTLITLRFHYKGGSGFVAFAEEMCEITKQDCLPVQLSFINGAVPVELTLFHAQATETGIQLTWSTSTETNNKGFFPQRSEDKRTWKELQFIPGAGTTTESRQYSLKDTPEKGGVFHYRLRQEDFDGNSHFSRIITAETDPEQYAFALAQNYPNPFNPSTMISYTLPNPMEVKLMIYDALGTVIGTIDSGLKDAGRHSVSFDAEHLANGIYYCMLEAGERRTVIKLLLLK